MNLLKEVLAAEVYPALGCTEPISCAYAAAVAAEKLDGPVTSLELFIDPGTYKNGTAVTVPGAEGEKGNLIAAALGALIARPEDKLELLRNVTPEILTSARRLIRTDACRLECLEDRTGFYVEARVSDGVQNARCILAGGHTTIQQIDVGGQTVYEASADQVQAGKPAYRQEIEASDLKSLLSLVETIDPDDMLFLQAGVDMNLEAARYGMIEGRTAGQMLRMHELGHLADDIFYRVKMRIAAAVDGRMSGAPRPVMTSGGSGNQGIVAILTAAMVGEDMHVEQPQILRSIAVAHLMNAYVKCFVGELSAVCGCSMAASIAAAAAIVYQQVGIDMEKISLAVNNVIGDLSGLICDGAKPGCAMKAITGVDTAIRSALMAIEGCGLADDEGVVGRTAEDSIRNLARISLEGMFGVDPTVLDIIRKKEFGMGHA